MSASVHGGGGRKGLRWVLCLVLLIDFYGIIENLYIIPAPDVALPWSPGWLVTLDVMVWPIVVLLIAYAIGVAGLARGKRAQMWFALLTLVTMAVLVEAMDAHVGQHRRRFYSTGAALAGWLIGLVFARVRKADDDRAERLAEAGAAAALAATYINAGIQKLLAGALFKDHSLPAHILTHHEIDDLSLFGSLSRHVALHPGLAMTLVLTTVVIQTGSWTYMVGPRLRMLWGSLLISFHLGTLVFLHIIYIEATILLVAWSYPWARIVARVQGRGSTKPVAPEDPPVAGHELVLLAGLGILIVGLSRVLPTPHEIPRPDYHHRYDQREPDQSPPSEPEGPGNTVASLGPLKVGDSLGGFEIASIAIGSGDARVELVCGEDRVTFGFSGPGGDAPEGPHSLGELHIYYSPSELEFAAIDEAGFALRERLAGETELPGEAVDAWIELARASLPKPEPGLGSPF